MKDLNLATYGVAELNEVEMMEIDGGVNWKKLAHGVCEIIEALLE